MKLINADALDTFSRIIAIVDNTEEDDCDDVEVSFHLIKDELTRWKIRNNL